MIEAAYIQDVLPVWTEDEAGPYQTIPYPGSHWHPAGKPVRYPHEYIRNGTAKEYPSATTVARSGSNKLRCGKLLNRHTSSGSRASTNFVRCLI